MAAAADSVSVVDISELLRQHLLQTHSLKEVTRGELDMSGLLISHEKTYHDESASSRERADGQTLFSSQLANTTDREQMLTLRTEREVTAAYKVSMQRCFTKDKNLSLSVSAPQSVMKAGIGAKRSLQLTAGRETNDTEVTRWSLSTNVQVPPGRRTQVTVSLVEEEMTSSFTVVSTIGGRAVFRPFGKDGRPHQRISPTVIDDLRSVLLEKDGFQKLPDQRAVTFKSAGSMYCRFGVKQEVKFNEEPLEAAEQ